MASVPLLMKKQQPRSPGVTRPEAGDAAPGFQQLLAVQRHALHLVADGLDDLGMIDPGGEDAVPAETVDILAAQEVLQDRSLTRPFHGGELSRLGHRLAIGEEPAIDELLVRFNGLGDEGLLLPLRHLPASDEVEIAVTQLQHLFGRQTQLIGPSNLRDGLVLAAYAVLMSFHTRFHNSTADPMSF
jgi:hypothetical protein